MNVSFFNYL